MKKYLQLTIHERINLKGNFYSFVHKRSLFYSFYLKINGYNWETNIFEPENFKQLYK